MNTKTLSNKALSVIDQYLDFKINKAVCSIPYYNNRLNQSSTKFRVQIGKGNPKDIYDEIESILVSEKINNQTLDSMGLKKLLVNRNIGIDCSGLVYYILNTESESTGKGSIDRHLSFPLCKGIIGKIRCKIRPIENADVSTFAHDKNSQKIPIKDAVPGNIITMISEKEWNHILVIHQIEYQNFVPITIHYTHAMAWPTDGQYGHGVSQGIIEILDVNKTLTEQKWIEKNKIRNENYTFARALKAQTEVRRMSWL
ncbi:MAG TPA: hypothetical protein VJJ28_00105 [Candidatus Paceibacterota bacterium]